MTTPVSSPVPVLCAALADDTRWRILVRLGEAPASASALARELPVSRQAIVKHLEVLRAVGLLESDKRGREVVHRTMGSELSALAHELDRVGRRWEQRLLALKTLAEAAEAAEATVAAEAAVATGD